MSCNAIMLDHETLGTTADSVIMSIGAVKFNLETGEIEPEGFYASVSIDSNLECGRRIQEDTLIWWMKQGPEAQSVFHEEKLALAPALEQFSDWVGDRSCSELVDELKNSYISPIMTRWNQTQKEL